MVTRNRSVAVPARISDGSSADPRISVANSIFHDIVNLVRQHGLEPVIITEPTINLDGYAGLVLPGGGDIDPARYGGSEIESLYDVNPDQDHLDFSLAEAALHSRIPILGICRGAQVINVVHGGSIVEDLPETSVQHGVLSSESGDLTFAWHEVEVVAGTHLLTHTRKSTLSVASGHHQGIGHLGEGLRASAVAADGLIEAFEDVSGRIVGVQWHPEASGTEPLVRDSHFQIFAAAVAEQARVPTDA